MNLGERITDQPLLESIPEGSSYLMEAGDGSGTKHVRHETVVAEIGKALPIGDMEELEELETLEATEEPVDPAPKEQITLVKAILKVLGVATSPFKGTDGIKAGNAGIVPAPAPDDKDKFLKADGTWDTPDGGGSGDSGNNGEVKAENVKFTDGMTAEEVVNQIIERLEPVGKIIAYMGTTAPENYLVCDGKTYNISDYPILAQHFRTEFGEEKYFGGDGEITFAVPDLRGEFLRGSGTGTRNTGSGAAVGEHQNGTEHMQMLRSSSNNLIIGLKGGQFKEQSTDKTIVGTTKDGHTIVGPTSTNDTTDSPNGWYTSRPTNTSVLYCIKYQ